MPPRSLQVLAGITAVAAALRFSTLGVQSFWFDEATTARLLDMDLDGMLSAIPDSESTPPLYYVVAWLWAKLFGLDEVGLRSLSALVGTATVPVVYALAQRVLSTRAALIAAALAATNPLLVWFSQEARAYALLVFLCALQTWLAARGRPLWGWALTAALALVTHYFALFVVGPTALWLLYAHRERLRAPAVAVGAVAVVGIALLPLAIKQSGDERADFIEESGLARRALQVPKQFLVGYAAPGTVVATIVAALVAAAGAWLVFRFVRGPERTWALRLAALGAVGVAVPLALALVGIDYLIARNVMAAWVPLFAALAAGLAVTRLGRAAAIVLCVIGIALAIGVNTDPRYQRDDWRGTAEALPPQQGGRALVVSPVNGITALEFYLRGAGPLAPTADVTVNEIDVIGLVRAEGGERPRPPRTPTPPPPPAFQEAQRIERETYTVIVYRSATPQRLRGDSLYRLSFSRFAALVQQPAAG